MENVQPQPDPIRFEEVSKTFRTGFRRSPVKALDSVRFSLEPGRILGLVGPNGSGKTTCFRIAAGLLKQDGGQVKIHGLAPGSMQAREQVGYMPELLGLPGTLTAREIVDFVGSVFNFSKAEKRARFDELRTLLDLSEFERRRMAGLSKGQLKRVGLATALYNRPGLLLLDEPLEGLDPLGAADIKAHLKTLAQAGTSILISSHILSDVESLCDRLLILHEGRVRVSGPTDAILEAGRAMQVRFSMPGEKTGSEEKSSEPSICDDIKRLIESKGGRVESAGPARQGLEGIFHDLFRGAAPSVDGTSQDGKES